MKRKNVKITGDVDGEKVFEVTWTAANDDWMRAGRLKARADAGDKEAAAELKRMDETPMVEISDEDANEDANEDLNEGNNKNEAKSKNEGKNKNEGKS